MDEGDGLIFISAISNGEKQLDYNQTMVCSKCGHFGRLNVFMTYMYFSLFFIPLIFWNRKYYVKSTCCNTLYSLSPKSVKRSAEANRLIYRKWILNPWKEENKHQEDTVQAAAIFLSRISNTAQNVAAAYRCFIKHYIKFKT